VFKIDLHFGFSGFLTTSGVEAVGFFHSDKQPMNESYPYIRLHMMAALTGTVTDKNFKSYLLKSNMDQKVCVE
jgi:hypothetical protein